MKKTMKQLREDKELSQEQLAELAGTSQPQIGRLEGGVRPMTVRWAQRLAPFLGCKPLDLLPLSETEENSPKMQSVKDLVIQKDIHSGGEDGVKSDQGDQEGKKVVPDTVLKAIGRLMLEVEGLKAELQEVKGARVNPRKAGRK
jgi:transcriptional regulator with XRE-family HTH domain